MAPGAMFSGRVSAFVVLSVLAGIALADVPEFDFARAAALDADTRQRYDVVFFNEIETWNVNSNRYASDSSRKRRAEFEQMARAGYFPAYAALRLAGIWPATLRHDPEALQMLLKQAEDGDPASMCATVAIPKESSLWPDRIAASRKYMIEAAARGHGACMAYYGGALLLGNTPGILADREAAMPLLLASARQGYFVAARRLFYDRSRHAAAGTFDFTDSVEVGRALCWGRLAQQHTNWSGFDAFLERMRDFGRKTGRSDLVERSREFDPRVVPISRKLVSPEDCAALEAASR